MKLNYIQREYRKTGDSHTFSGREFQEVAQMYQKLFFLKGCLTLCQLDVWVITTKPNGSILHSEWKRKSNIFCVLRIKQYLDHCFGTGMGPLWILISKEADIPLLLHSPSTRVVLWCNERRTISLVT